MHSMGYLLKEGLKSLWKNRTMSIASIGVLISCLLLTGIAMLLSLNLSTTMESVESTNSILVFLKEDVPSLTAVRIGEEIRQLDNIGECVFVHKDDALTEITQSMGDEDGTLMQGLQGSDNPLPDSFEISMNDLSQYDATVEAIQAIDGVDEVSDYSYVADQLSNLDRLVRYASIAILIVLGIVSCSSSPTPSRSTMFSAGWRSTS